VIKVVVIRVAVASLVVAAIVGLALYSLSNIFNLKTSRTHLTAIPIAASACPYVLLMHASANTFQSAEPIFDEIYIDAHGNDVTPPWPDTRARILAVLLNLQAVIFVSTLPTTDPTPTDPTLDAIHTGLTQFAAAQHPFGLATGTSQALEAGQTAFGYASDLVGTQCRVPLGANSPFAQAVATTSVTTHP